MAVDAVLNVNGRRDPLRGMKFQVRIPEFGGGAVNMGFSKISGISQESEVIEYREGDQPLVQKKIPGLIKTGEVSLERGVGASSAMWLLNQWRRNTSTAQAGVTDGSTNYRKTVEISSISREGPSEWTVNLHNAWPSKLEYSDLDANASDIWISTLSLVYEQVIVHGTVPADVLGILPMPRFDASFNIG